MKITVVLPVTTSATTFDTFRKVVHAAAIPAKGDTLGFNNESESEDEAEVETVRLRTGKAKAPAVAAEVWLAAIGPLTSEELARLHRRGWHANV